MTVDPNDPALIAAEAVLCERHLYDFVQCAWHVIEPATPFVRGWHIEAICEHLEAVSLGDILNLAINVPPGSTKSITCGVMWPVWEWIHRPSTRWLCASNEDSLVIRDAVAARRLIDSDWFRMRWGDRFRLTTDQNVKSLYENDRRGHRTSTTVASKVTGKKGDILLLDDPHDAKGVESENARKAATEWFTQAFYNRVTNDKTGRRVVIGQRTHQSDLFSVLPDSFVRLCIPEEFDARRRCVTPIWKDPRTVDGELLRPERFGQDEIADYKQRDAIGYATQHQQLPSPRGGSAFQSTWLRYYSIDGDYLVLHDPERGDRRISRKEFWLATVADTASTTKTYSDFTAIGTFAYRPPDMLVWDMVRARMEEPDAIIAIRAANQKHRPRILAVGDKPKGVGQTLRRPGPQGFPALSVRDMPEITDKFAKSLDARTLARNGNLWLPRSAAWVVEYETELLAFTPAMTHAHDDQVDVTSHAATLMREVVPQLPDEFARQARAGLVVGGR